MIIAYTAMAIAVLQKYQNYINNYEAMSKRLQQLRATNKDLQDFITKFCESTTQPDISFFFILPIQRLPRYEVRSLHLTYRLHW